MTIAEKTTLVKKNIKMFKGVTVASLKDMSEAELDQMIATIEAGKSEESESSETVEIIGTDTFTTQKGEIVPITNATFVGMSSGGAFKFQTESGQIIVSNDSDLRFLKSKGGLNIGDVIAFRPESIQLNERYNNYTGIPNKSASPVLMKVLDYRTANREANLAIEAELQAQGITPTQARSLVQDKIAQTVLTDFKRPPFEL